MSSQKGTVLMVLLSVLMRTISASLTRWVSKILWSMSSGMTNSRVLSWNHFSKRKVKILKTWVTSLVLSMSLIPMEVRSWLGRRGSARDWTQVQPTRASQGTNQKRNLIESSVHLRMVFLIRTCSSNFRITSSKSRPEILTKTHNLSSMSFWHRMFIRKSLSTDSLNLCRMQKRNWGAGRKQRGSLYDSHLIWWRTSWHTFLKQY